MTARCVMVLGTTSGAGKSWLTTALCRYYARQGLKVAPFKAQNMSNNARVVGGRSDGPPQARPAPSGGSAVHAVTSVGAMVMGRSDGPPQARPAPTSSARGSAPPKAHAVTSVGVISSGEIGSAQYFQALAANAVPEVRMNPLLLKPEKDTQSQVVLMGQVNPALTAMPWRARSLHVWPAIAQALDELIADNDVVVIEGAGSPAEINLKDSDIVNMRVALHAQAKCLLVADIDRGGAFAHLYGTWAMLDAAEQALIKGFVLNKFRGDPALLAPGPQMLEDLTGVPTVATLPMWWQHGLPEEDGVFDMAPTFGTGLSSLPPERAAAPVARQSRFHGPGLNGSENFGSTADSAPATIAVIAYPRISNLDEFQPLKNVPGVRLMWVRNASELAGLGVNDWIILPGSKATSADLDWLRKQGLDSAIAHHAASGGRVLGICGGLQMLGEALVDPYGIDGNGPGLGLLGVVTQFEQAKTVRHRVGVFGEVHGAWSPLSCLAVQGYEIHHGVTSLRADMAAAGDGTRQVMADGLAWQNAAGNVVGVYLHGLFEDPALLKVLFGAEVPTLDRVFDGLADYVGQYFEPGVLQALVAA